MNAEDLITLNEEIAGMARAGLPLDRGLSALAREMGRGRLRQVTQAIAADLRAGQTLPQALERQAGRIPPFYAGLVAAGVRTGRVGEVLATLTSYARAISNLRGIIIDALFYPLVVVTFATVLFGFLCFWLLPQFEQLFKEFNLRLPAVTELALEFGRRPLELVVYPLGILILTVLALWAVLNASERGRRTWARLAYSIPIGGTLIRSARLAAFSDLLGILVDHEVPLPEAFRLCGMASSDPLMATSAQEVHDDLAKGLPLAAVLHDRGLVPEWVSWMTGVGERRGSLGKTLHQVAEVYRRQVEIRAALLRSVLPPLLIIGIAGVFVIFFVLALILPMYGLLEGLS